MNPTPSPAATPTPIPTPGPTPIPAPSPVAGAASERGDASEVRVSTLTMDRPCTGCFYNLVGQSVVREPRYGLLIVRCPECGAVASLQEYPMLGRWSARWAKLLAALWMLAIVPALILSIWIVVGFWAIIGSEVASPAIARAQESMQLWIEAKHPGKQIWQLPAAEQNSAIREWWAEVGGASGFAASQGGWINLVDWWPLGTLIPCALLAVGVGAAWSLALLGVPRRRLWRVAAVLVVLFVATTAIMIVMRQKSRRAFYAQSWYAELTEFSVMRIEYPAGIVAMLLLSAALFVGLWFGRPLARLLVRVFLPPHLRWGLSLLWTAEGLRPPGGSQR